MQATDSRLNKALRTVESSWLRDDPRPNEERKGDRGVLRVLDGSVTVDGKVWGGPVGVAVGNDGVLYVSDDGPAASGV